MRPLTIAIPKGRVLKKLAPLFEKRMKKLGADPWKTRNDYIRVVMDRSEENLLTSK